jgi:hypothetical protein
MNGGVTVMQTSNTKYHKRAQHVLIICVGLAIFVGGLFIPASVNSEGQKVKPERIMPKHYPPDGFDGYGQIDRISTQEVVIDDNLFKLARSVTYVTPNDNIASRSDFEMGDLVGYLENSDREINWMWLIKKGSPNRSERGGK